MHFAISIKSDKVQVITDAMSDFYCFGVNAEAWAARSEIILHADAAGNIIGGLPPQLRACK